MGLDEWVDKVFASLQSLADIEAAIPDVVRSHSQLFYLLQDEARLRAVEWPEDGVPGVAWRALLLRIVDEYVKRGVLGA